jgi:hypothetical protein
VSPVCLTHSVCLCSLPSSTSTWARTCVTTECACYSRTLPPNGGGGGSRGGHRWCWILYTAWDSWTGGIRSILPPPISKTHVSSRVEPSYYPTHTLHLFTPKTLTVPSARTPRTPSIPLHQKPSTLPCLPVQPEPCFSSTFYSPRHNTYLLSTLALQRQTLNTFQSPHIAYPQTTLHVYVEQMQRQCHFFNMFSFL